MRLKLVIANRHIFVGEARGRPLRLLLKFDNERALRLQVAGDGARMLIDDSSLDAPFDMGEYGQVDIADVTQSLFPSLRGVEVKDVQGLVLHDHRIGVKLNLAGGEAYNFWVDGDEIHWGDEASLLSYEWLDGMIPTASDRIQV